MYLHEYLQTGRLVTNHVQGWNALRLLCCFSVLVISDFIKVPAEE